MTLTAKQERFCLAYLKSGNASDAYRQAYDAGGMKAETVHRKAKDLLDNGKITARVQELRAPVVAEAQMTLEAHFNALAKIRDAALRDGQYGPAVAAERSRGQAAGFYVNRARDETPGAGVLRVITTDMPPEEAARAYAQMVRK